MEEQVDKYLNSLTSTNRTLRSYVDWEAVINNSEIHKINLRQLNIFTKARNNEDLMQYITQIFNIKRENAFESLEILIAKREGNNEYLDDESWKIKTYNLKNIDGVYYFMLETKLLNLFKSVTSLVDYVFGAEVGLNSNARKNKSGNQMEQWVESILIKSNINFSKQATLDKINGFYTSNKKIKRVDFVFERDEITYLIESSFYNGKGSKISETCNSYADFTSKLDKTKFKLIWVADGNGMKTIRKLLIEQWNNIEVMNIKQFEDWLNIKK